MVQDNLRMNYLNMIVSVLQLVLRSAFILVMMIDDRAPYKGHSTLARGGEQGADDPSSKGRDAYHTRDVIL